MSPSEGPNFRSLENKGQLLTLIWKRIKFAFL